MDTITGTVERITFYNPDNGYSVVKIRPDKRFPDAQARDGTLTIIGTMPELGVGEALQLTGDWINDPKYGKQFRVETVMPTQPTTLDGIRNYLASGIVKGIGEATAAKIVDHFGVQTLDILNRDPQKLKEVKGLKTSLADKLAVAWEDNVAVRNTMIFLQQYGVSSKMAARIHGEYGGETVARVKENPYMLAADVFGIGFLRADQIARNMGIPVDSADRMRAGLIYALNKLASDGHTFAPVDVLLSTGRELLNLENSPDLQDRIAASLADELRGGALVRDEVGYNGATLDAVYLQQFFRAETKVAQLLRNMRDLRSAIIKKMSKTKWESYLAKLAQKNEVQLTDQQQGAVKAALTEKVCVLTGGPGTGKTTTLKMVIEALVQERFKFALASPTGRAAKRLQEATGFDAFTIHRLLAFAPGEGGFGYNEESPLEVDMLIVDEASMIDLTLFAHLLRALRPDTHLMLVGDIDQLPSVGAGNVLRDVIDSGIAHVTRLDVIFRQGEDSHIIVNAHRINQGEIPYMDNRSQDFYFFGSEDPIDAAELVVDIVQNRLPNKFGYEPMDEVQVIAPMYRGAIGVHALNEALQAALNGNINRKEKKLGGRTFRVGDKVMQTRNNYEKDVFNGDIGRIHGIDDDENILEISIDGRYIIYDFTEADELIHAYCISTHRSQGSEYPVVVMPLMTQHYMMLQRNLLYTAITRAKKLVVLVGDRKAVAMAVRNNKVSERYSGLLSRLKA